MAGSFLQALDDEIAALEADLATDPRYAKLAELRRLRRLYSEPSPIIGVNPPRSKSTGRRASPERQAVENAVEAILKDIGGITPHFAPMPLADIHRSLESRGVSIPGKDPRNNLSAILSNSPKFEPHGRAGWTLKLKNAETADLPSQDASAASADARPTSEPNPW
jgi:hypothetical protein